MLWGKSGKEVWGDYEMSVGTLSCIVLGIQMLCEERMVFNYKKNL